MLASKLPPAPKSKYQPVCQCGVRECVAGVGRTRPFRKCGLGKEEPPDEERTFEALCSEAQHSARSRVGKANVDTQDGGQRAGHTTEPWHGTPVPIAGLCPMGSNRWARHAGSARGWSRSPGLARRRRASKMGIQRTASTRLRQSLHVALGALWSQAVWSRAARGRMAALVGAGGRQLRVVTHKRLAKRGGRVLRNDDCGGVSAMGRCWSAAEDD